MSNLQPTIDAWGERTDPHGEPLTPSRHRTRLAYPRTIGAHRLRVACATAARVILRDERGRVVVIEG